jgi:hypothetical protein
MIVSAIISSYHIFISYLFASSLSLRTHWIRAVFIKVKRVLWSDRRRRVAAGYRELSLLRKNDTPLFFFSSSSSSFTSFSYFRFTSLYSSLSITAIWIGFRKLPSCGRGFKSHIIHFYHSGKVRHCFKFILKNCPTDNHRWQQ